MSENNRLLAPEEIARHTVENGIKKANASFIKLLVLGILAGAFIAFAAEGSNAAIYGINNLGLGKALAGALFATGLMLVIIAGGELFTGNTLMVCALAERKIKLRGLLKNWVAVYTGNFVGALIIVLLIYFSGQLGFSHDLLGAFTIKTAAYKTSLTFMNAFSMGILCNWLVTLAVWMAYGTKDMMGRLFAIFFPIWLFITSGFEHSVANMYYIPMGILAKGNVDMVSQAMSLGATSAQIEGLNWANFFAGNLLPVTLGNIVGGVLFTGLAYWFVYINKKEAAKN